MKVLFFCKYLRILRGKKLIFLCEKNLVQRFLQSFTILCWPPPPVLRRVKKVLFFLLSSFWQFWERKNWYFLVKKSWPMLPEIVHNTLCWPPPVLRRDKKCLSFFCFCFYFCFWIFKKTKKLKDFFVKKIFSNVACNRSQYSLLATTSVEER